MTVDTANHLRRRSRLAVAILAAIFLIGIGAWMIERSRSRAPSAGNPLRSSGALSCDEANRKRAAADEQTRRSFELALMVRRLAPASRARPTLSYAVDACSWGCGSPPSPVPPPPPPEQPFCIRNTWLLPAGRVYRGDVQIAYDASGVELHYTRDCPDPA